MSSKCDVLNYIQDDLVNYWFTCISNKVEMYKEPILDSETVKFFQEVCEIFEQSTNVFILSVEVAEDYIRAKNDTNEAISDWLLTALTITFICHKSEGAQDSLKTQHVIDVLFHFASKMYKPAQVTAAEADILHTLNGKLPITSIVDDLDIITQVHFAKWRLKVNIRPLCLKLLELIYIERRGWFSDLKHIYNRNEDCRTVFQNLITSKVFLPVCILISALQLTQYANILDMDSVIKDMSDYTTIHTDHLTILSVKIMELINVN